MRKLILPVRCLIAARNPPIGQQPALNQLVVDAFGGRRPEERGRTALRLESKVGMVVGHGVYRSVTLLYS